MGDVTRILADIERGDRHAAGQLLPLVYDELRKLAAARLAQEAAGIRSRRRRWSMRRTFGWSATTPDGPFDGAVISSPPRPRPCGGSWSTGPVIAAARSAAAATGGSGSIWMPSWSSPPATICWRWTRP